MYGTFASYPLRHPVIGCPCCVSRADQERIASKVLRQLDGYDLERFTWKAMSTWGDEDDFKHFLPRILELVSDAQERRDLPYLFVIFGKLGYCKEWTEQEREAVTNYLLALWRWILAGHPGREEDSLLASEYLEAMLYGIDDLAPFLNAWRDMCMPSSLRQLAEVISNHAWDSRLAKSSQVQAWLREDATGQMLEEGFYTYIDEDWVEELALAVEVWEWTANSALLAYTAPRDPL
ncbi:hypothetical protein [Ktedonobacter sp. SOSP1-85]|uniref:hypothetical protein n=1 Tax=Ktedonobacter sp. SOSP1-85 TaxID=2778367 RepID=UPI0019156FB0|nr:hypothetical protein [Ktedonobacter sp. SOSP1-85]